MTGYSIFLLLFIASVDDPPKDTPEARARRAAIVDRIMGEAGAPRVRVVLPPPDEPAVQQQPAAFGAPGMFAAPQPAVQFQIRVFDGAGAALNRQARTLSLEMPGGDPVADGEEMLPPAPRQFDANTAVLGRENFDRWIFGDGMDPGARRIRLQTLLSKKIDTIMKNHDINTLQLKKLRLAGSGDIKRFLDRVEDKRVEFDEARKNFNLGHGFLQKLTPLSAEFQTGPFGDDSFFAKVLKKIEEEAKEER